MSMNIHLSAELQGNFTLKTGKKIKKNIVVDFDCIQTSSDETEDILNSEDKYEAYKEFVKNLYDEENCNFFIYDDDDLFCEGTSVDVVIENEGDCHIKRLDAFIKEHEGWNIIWYSL